MTHSPACIELVKLLEGFSATAYQDGKFCSIGYGHHGPDVSLGMTITQARAQELLEQDLLGVSEAIDPLVLAPLTQNQFDALVSFTYNVGVGSLKRSKLLRLVNKSARNAGQQQQLLRDAADQLLAWNKEGRPRKPSKGLTRRRRIERALFLKDLP